MGVRVNDGREMVPSLTGADVDAVARVLEMHGWLLRSVDVTLLPQLERARIDIVRHDGRRVFLDAEVRPNVRRASITVTQFEVERVAVGAGGLRSAGGGMPVDRLTERFISRHRASGARAGMRLLAGYVADNAIAPMRLESAKACFRALLSAPRTVAVLA